MEIFAHADIVRVILEHTHIRDHTVIAAVCRATRQAVDANSDITLAQRAAIVTYLPTNVRGVPCWPRNCVAHILRGRGTYRLSNRVGYTWMLLTVSKPSGKFWLTDVFRDMICTADGVDAVDVTNVLWALRRFRPSFVERLDALLDGRTAWALSLLPSRAGQVWGVLPSRSNARTVYDDRYLDAFIIRADEYHGDMIQLATRYTRNIGRIGAGAATPEYGVWVNGRSEHPPLTMIHNENYRTRIYPQ